MSLDGDILERSVQFEIYNHADTRVDEVEVYLEGEEELLSKLAVERRVPRVYLNNSRKSGYINGDDKETYVLASWNSAEKKRHLGNHKNDKSYVISDFAIYSLKIFVTGAKRKKEQFELKLITVPCEPPFFIVLAQENHIKR